PVPGLFDSIDPEYRPKGWTFDDERLVSADGTIQVTTRVSGPNGKRGWLRRIYDPKHKALIMEAAFLQELPRWIDAGVPMVAGKGTPTVTYLTLRQIKQAGGAIGELKTVKMSTIQNIEAILQLAQIRQSMQLDEAVAMTHSVQYARTSIEQ